MSLRALLERINGYIQFAGGLHIRGACLAPSWHSLRRAWEGEEAFYRHYEAVLKEDIPFGQDCVGDQFLLRSNSIIKLHAETGDTEELGITFTAFLEAVQHDPVEMLSLYPLLQFREQNRRLLPGELLSVYPPFCTEEAAGGVQLDAIRAEDRLSFLFDLSKRLNGIAGGTQLAIEVQEHSVPPTNVSPTELSSHALPN